MGSCGYLSGFGGAILVLFRGCSGDFAGGFRWVLWGCLGGVWGYLSGFLGTIDVGFEAV